MECYVCGHTLPADANFCPGCGRTLGAAPKISTDADSPAPPAGSPVPPAEPVRDAVPAPITGADNPDECIPDAPNECAPDAPEAPELPPSPNPAGGDEPSPAPAEVPVRRRCHSALVPILAMVGMMLIGLVCFWLIPMNSAASSGASSAQTSQSPTEPGRNPQSSTQSVDPRDDSFIPADESYFAMTGDGLVFFSYGWEGAVLVIPNEIDGEPVTRIAEDGFRGCAGITTIILPDNLESIGDSAFENCVDLRGIYIPAGVHTIGERAFAGCAQMESAAVMSGVERIGADAFDGCASLRYIFYAGDYARWTELYSEFITPFTYVTCTDGDYYHGVELP